MWWLIEKANLLMLVMSSCEKVARKATGWGGMGSQLGGKIYIVMTVKPCSEL